MKESTLKVGRSVESGMPGALALLALLLLAPGCVRRSHHHHAPPTYVELEVNDDAFSANDFGVLLPGDRFFIEGFITDLGTDPFDGFAFTAGEPVHVDFQLFVDDGHADLDVCLYDPQLDLTVDCFRSPSNPERGGVDVLGGGLDFHLVVESFIGSSTYAMEILVTPLYHEAAVADAPGTAPHGLRAVDPVSGESKGASWDSFSSYGGVPPTGGSSSVKGVTVIEVDPDTGERTETTTIVAD